MRRGIATCATAGVMTVGALTSATPAVADHPAEYEAAFGFQDVNPCTGELVDYWVSITVDEHGGHPHNFVGRTSGTGVSSDGYTLAHRTEHFQANEHTIALNLVEFWTHPDGSRFRARINGKVDAVTGQLRFEKTALDCLAE
jgi:hypothetical protein